MSKNTGTSELINYFDLGANGDVGISGSLTLDTIANATTDTDTFLVSDTGIIKYRTGAQLLSDIGGQAAGNYVTLDTIQTITARKDFSNNTIALNVNGTSQRTLVSNSPIDSGSYSGAINAFGFNASNNLYFSKGGDNNGIFAFSNAVTRTYTLQDASGTLAFTSQIPANPVGGTGTTNYLPKFTGSTTIGNSQIFDNGTGVGIGINSPSNKLDVLGSAASPNLVGTNAYSRFYQSGGYANVTIGALASGSFAGWIQTSDGVGTAIALSLQPSGGNLLVGTTTDNGAKLQVSGTATVSGNVAIGTNPASASVGAVIRLPFDNAIRWRNSSNTADLGFYLGGSNLFTFDSGISVTGAATFSSSVTANGAKPQLLVSGNSGNGAGIHLTTALSGSNRRNWGIFTEENIEGDFAIKCSTAAGGNPGSGDTRFLITRGGNVLIGTTTDVGYKLDVAGTIRSLSATPLVVSMTSNPGNHAIIAARWTSGVGMDMSYFPDFAQGFIDNTYQSLAGTVYGDIYFRQNISGTMTTRMMIKADGGRVGIGTTNPAGRLSVNDAVYGEYLRVATGVIGGNQTSVYLAWNNGGNITLQQVTVGAADSGGSGFRLLRIPNT